MRWFWKWYLWSEDWSTQGEFPYHIKKMVIIVGPHTHWKDFIIGVAVRSAYRFSYVKFLGKQELFKPPFGFLFRWLGGTPVDRSNNNNLVDAVVQKFNDSESLVIALSPEGTRKKVEKLRTGFYHIARQAGVPIMMVGFDFKNHKVIFDEPFMTTENEAADFERITNFYRPIEGKIPEQGLMHF